MSGTVDTGTAQHKFTSLRKRLDQLGYKQPLGVESLPLVEKLFADLVHTTDSLKKCKLEKSKTPVESGKLDGYVEAYKSDNAKLVKENNQIHQQLIKKTEDAHSVSTDLKGSIRKLEHENADLKFLNNQYVHKIRALEKESKQKTDKILLLQEKNFHAVVHTPGGRKKSIPFRRQRMDVDCLIAPADDLDTSSSSPAVDPYMADLLRVADNTIAQLREETRIAREDKQGLDVKIDGFRKQVEARDHEIDRLTGLLEGGRPYDIIALEARNRSNERLISHLNIQIDYLQQKNAEVQKQLDEALLTTRRTANRTLELDSRNAELSNELHDVDRLAQRLQADKDSVIRSADTEVAQTLYELEKARNDLEAMEHEMAQLKTDHDQLGGEKSLVITTLTSEKAEVARLQDLLDRLTNDKRKLANRVNKLISNERELVLEIDRLKHRNGYSRGKRAKSPGRLETFIAGLEEERDYWKSEVDTLHKLLRSDRRSRSVSPKRGRSRTPSRTGSRTGSRTNSRNSSPASNKLESLVRNLEAERDQLQKQLLTRRSSSPTAKPQNNGMMDDDELSQVQQERDELQRMLDKFERHMAEIQANVKVLTTERDNLSSLYEDTKEELTRLRREVVRSPKSAKTSLAAQAVLRRVENERDDARADLRRMTTDRDTIRERLKIATETQLADRARLEQRIEDIEAALRASDRERQSSDDQVVSLQRLAEQLEAQLKERDVLLAQSRDDTNQEKANAAHIRLLAEQAEQSASSSKQQLSTRSVELSQLEAELQRNEGHIAELQHSHSQQREQINRLQATVAALDRDKDALQSVVDERAESLQQARVQLNDKERSITDLRLGLSEQEVTLERTRDTTSSKEREIGSLRRQLDSTAEELTEVSRAREVALRENRRMQDDLATMTRENQSVINELQDTLHDREELKNQVQDYVLEVKRAEDLIASKEQERSDLLEQYRALSLDAERYETQSHQLESESSNLRLELMTKDSEVRRLREKVDGMDRQICDYVSAGHGYDVQVSQVTSALAAADDKVRRVEVEKEGLQHDLAAVRDLCARLEATKDKLQRQLTSKTLDEEKLQALVDDLRGESELLRDQVGTERSSLKSLESLLHTNREKEFASQMTMQEYESELQIMRDRLALNESKMDSQNRELSGLRNRLIELEADNDRMRRNLTNERFERERAVQELRRHGFPTPGDSRLSSSRVASSPSYRPDSEPRKPRSRSPSPSYKYSK